MRIAIYTLGCKVNQFESQAIAEQFAESGHEVVPWREPADIYVVNTCAVTARAASQSRQMIRRFRREFPGSKIVATGCHVQTDAASIMKAAQGRICLAGNDQKHRLVEIALEGDDCLQMYVGDIFQVRQITPFMIHSPEERTRAYVRIQDGCESFCAYCIVPFARGRSRSMPPEQVAEQVARLSSEGVREIVITGIHVGLYGTDLSDDVTLASVMKSLCSGYPHIRFRLSSIDPSEISDDLIELALNAENFCPHWHLPLQSGSDLILQAMNRRYNSSDFRSVVERLYSFMPDAAFGFDVMTGFPGETDDEFMETVRLLESLPLTYLHVFPYSPRPDTVAAAMKGHVSKRKKQARAAVLRKLGSRKKGKFYKKNLETEHNLLIERRDEKTGLWHGMTENYISTFLKGSEKQENLQNHLLRVRIREVDDRVAFAEAV